MIDDRPKESKESKMTSNESYVAVGVACMFTALINEWSVFHYIAYVKGGDRFVNHYDDSLEKWTLFASLATSLTFTLNYVNTPWIQGVMTSVVAEILMSVLSIVVAYIRGRRRLPRPLKKRDIKRVATLEIPKSRLKKLCSRPPQVVRWDILGVALSGLFGKLASVPLPRCLRAPYFRWYARKTGANLDEIDGDLESFPSLRAFFTRKLKPGSRPISRDDLVSPVDGKVVVFGKVTSDRIEQIKGVTYSSSDFLGEDDPLLNHKHNKKSVFHVVIYLNPGDYHRLHSPCKFAIHRLRHFPGTLFPISPLLSRLVPDLFSLNERVVLQGSWKHGAMSYVAVGAYNVGSMSFNFDKTIRTNRLIRDWRNPNLSISGMRRDIGDYAYERSYDPAILVNKASEIGTFNLGSTVVMLFEAPDDFEFDLSVNQKIKLGQSIGHVIVGDGGGGSISSIPTSASPTTKRGRKKSTSTSSSSSSSKRRSSRRQRSKTPTRKRRN